MINKVADVLGIKVDEDFTANNGRTYKLNSDGELLVLHCGIYVRAGQSLSDLISGKLKRIWKPEVGERYYTIDLNSLYMISDDCWESHHVDIRRLGRNLVFKTEEEAREKLDKILNVLEVDKEMI